jgi:hypothetical protein
MVEANKGFKTIFVNIYKALTTKPDRTQKKHAPHPLIEDMKRV